MHLLLSVFSLKMASVGRNMLENLLRHKEWSLMYISLAECNSDTIQKLRFAVNIMIELKNVTATSDGGGPL